jgi:4-amino-4-deoxy-L-arabinose transferase-like glycosyltransferase
VKDAGRWWSREDLLLIVLVGILFFLPGVGPLGDAGSAFEMPHVQLFDKDEPRFSEAGREMLVSHDYLVPRFNGVYRPDKPPLLYWEMQASYALVGVNELGARLPSMVCGIGSLLVIYWMTGRRFGRLTGILAALILASTSLFIAESRLATADSTMIFFSLISLGCGWIAWETGSPRKAVGIIPRAGYRYETGAVLDHVPPRVTQMNLGHAILFWVALACGTLAKGVPLLFVFLPMIALSIATGAAPRELARWRSYVHVRGWNIALAAGAIVLTSIGLILRRMVVDSTGAGYWVVCVGALLVLMALMPQLPGMIGRCIRGGNWGWWKQLRPMWGFPLLIALVAWWPIAVYASGHGALIEGMVSQQRDRVLATGTLKTQYKQPFGFYIAFMWITFWPWSVLIVPGAYHCVKRMLGRTAIAIDPRPYQFLFAWVVPTWIVYECIASKLVHYVLPLFIGMVIVYADMLAQSWHRLSDVLAARWFGWMRWVLLVIWFGLAAVVLFVVHQLVPGEQGLRAAAAVAVVLAATGIASAATWNKPSWPFAIVLGWGAALAMGNTLIMPAIAGLKLSSALGDRMNQLASTHQLLACGYDEPTLIFYTREQAKFVTPERLVELWKQNVIVAATQSAATEAGTPPATSGAVISTPEHLAAAVTDEVLDAMQRAGLHPQVAAEFFGVPPLSISVKGAAPTGQRVRLIVNDPPMPAATGPGFFDEIEARIKQKR